MPENWLQMPPVGWVISNPPFNQASKILPLAFQHARIGMAMLLRLSYLEPCRDRGAWLEEHRNNLTDVIVFNPRIKFRTDRKGTDSCTVAWFIWQKGIEGETRMSFVRGASS